MSRLNQIDEYNKKSLQPLVKNDISILKSIQSRVAKLTKLISSENGKIKRNWTGR